MARKRLDRWSDLIVRFDKATQMQTLDVRLSESERCQLMTCMVHWYKEFTQEAKMTPQALTAIKHLGHKGPTTKLDLCLAAGAAEWVILGHEDACKENPRRLIEERMAGASSEARRLCQGPFTDYEYALRLPFCCSSCPGEYLSRDDLLAVTDRIYTALGGGIKPGHYRQRN